jgi:hypothetical protein
MLCSMRVREAHTVLHAGSVLSMLCFMRVLGSVLPMMCFMREFGVHLLSPPLGRPADAGR